MNQAEEYRVAERSQKENRYLQMIPGDYTDSPYSLIYYSELRDKGDNAWLYPGFEPDLSNQPYFVIRQESRGLR